MEGVIGWLDDEIRTFTPPLFISFALPPFPIFLSFPFYLMGPVLGLSYAVELKRGQESRGCVRERVRV